MDRFALCFVSLLFIFGIVSAGTVTLTGSCKTIISNNATANFSLLNSGNDTAFNLVITPFIVGVQQQQKAYTISSLGPGSEKSIDANFTGIKQSGTYGGYFYAAYQQGSDVFMAVFPCLLSFFRQTQTQVLLSSNTTLGANGDATVRISAFNEGADSLEMLINLVVPPTFTYNGSEHYSLTLAPYQRGNVTFRLKVPSGQASYSAAAFISYSKGNLSFASSSTFVIAAQSQTSAKLSSLIPDLAILAIVIVLILILVSILRRKRNRSQV
ncbi:MAG: hypothetical protein ABSD68_01740 [Candidatus Micrarchaeales archaeon]|jgi:hypothetical protein